MFLFSPIRWALRIPSMVIAGAVVYVLVTGGQVIAASRQGLPAANVPRVAAIVVLPAPVEGSAPSPDLLARLREAAALVKAGVARKVIVSADPEVGPQAAAASAGGHSEPIVGGSTPSAIAEVWLVAHGVRSSEVIPLHARSAGETLSAAAVLVGTPAPVVIVTDAIDALFARGAASTDGLEAVVAPAIGSASISLSELGPLWRQATGVAAGRVIGYSRATWAGG